MNMNKSISILVLVMMMSALAVGQFNRGFNSGDRDLMQFGGGQGGYGQEGGQGIGQATSGREAATGQAGQAKKGAPGKTKKKKGGPLGGLFG